MYLQRFAGVRLADVRFAGIRFAGILAATFALGGSIGAEVQRVKSSSVPQRPQRPEVQFPVPILPQQSVHITFEKGKWSSTVFYEYRDIGYTFSKDQFPTQGGRILVNKNNEVVGVNITIGSDSFDFFLNGTTERSSPDRTPLPLEHGLYLPVFRSLPENLMEWHDGKRHCKEWGPRPPADMGYRGTPEYTLDHFCRETEWVKAGFHRNPTGGIIALIPVGRRNPGELFRTSPF